jgi:hypothetical protein
VGADIPRSVGGSKLAIGMGTHGLCTA